MDDVTLVCLNNAVLSPAFCTEDSNNFLWWKLLSL